MYYLGQIAVRLVLWVVFRLRVYGDAHIPKSGPVLLCVNHISNWDPITVACAAGRRVNFMAKEELFRFPPLAALLRRLYAFPVKRGAGDRKAIRTALEILENGGLLVVFPEGTRGSGALPERIERGAGLMAARSGAQLLPVIIRGRYRLFGPLTLTFGAPFTIGGASGPPISAEEATRMILQGMQAVWKEASLRV